MMFYRPGERSAFGMRDQVVTVPRVGDLVWLKNDDDLPRPMLAVNWDYRTEPVTVHVHLGASYRPEADQRGAKAE